jgi:hypothetical protein
MTASGGVDFGSRGAVRNRLTCSSASRASQKTASTVTTSALAFTIPTGSANLNALPLSPGALRLRLRSLCVFAPALIAHAGEEQDLSGAAITRSDTTGTVRGPEMDDIVQLRPP